MTRVKDRPVSGRSASAANTDHPRVELAGIRARLQAELDQARADYDHSLHGLDLLHPRSPDGAGDDQVEASSRLIGCEEEEALAVNRLNLLIQIQHAIERVEAGSYGLCEMCGNPIPKARLQAVPIATLDVTCKRREERRQI